MRTRFRTDLRSGAAKINEDVGGDDPGECEGTQHGSDPVIETQTHRLLG